LPDRCNLGEKKVILVKVTSACGVCHTELDEIERQDLTSPIFLLFRAIRSWDEIEQLGRVHQNFNIGGRVGIAWIYSACGTCKFCCSGNENLCPEFVATGRDINGGYAQYMVAREDYAFVIPSIFSDMEAAPLLCAGAIGYRSLRLTGMQNGKRLGLNRIWGISPSCFKNGQTQVPGI